MNLPKAGYGDGAYLSLPLDLYLKQAPGATRLHAAIGDRRAAVPSGAVGQVLTAMDMSQSDITISRIKNLPRETPNATGLMYRDDAVSWLWLNAAQVSRGQQRETWPTRLRFISQLPIELAKASLKRLQDLSWREICGANAQAIFMYKGQSGDHSNNLPCSLDGQKRTREF